MAFTDALYGTPIMLEGVLAKRAAALENLRHMLVCRQAIAMVTDEFDAVLETVAPDVLVDARMHKRDAPRPLMGIARFTIGLGPGFAPGVNVDVAVETQWGPHLGLVLETGHTRALAGEPRKLSGRGRERFVYAAGAGSFRSALEIGDRVHAGQVVGHIDDVAVKAPLTGWLRGLAHNGAQVSEGGKIVEIDVAEPPRGRELGERPRRIAAGVMQALERATRLPPQTF
jgi:xanthine dehydrogenase accessory factor